MQTSSPMGQHQTPHKAGAIDELNSFKTWGCKLSVPGDLCGFSLISSFLIPFIVIAIEGIIRRLV